MMMENMVEENKEAKKDLPDECWELIFKRLVLVVGHHNDDDYHHLDAVSLVCKRFLSISSHLLHSLTISDPRILLHFSNLSRRFIRIKRIHIPAPRCVGFFQELRALTVEIAQSGLNIEHLRLSDHHKLSVKKGLQEICSNLKDLKTLTCKNCNLTEKDLIVIANSLPKLEELKIYFRAVITDNGIEELASKLKGLRKIKLIISGRNVAVASSSSSTTSLTANGIGNAFLRQCSNLSSLSLSYYKFDFSSAKFAAFQNSSSYTRALCALEFYFSVISDGLVASIVNANLPLKKLKFHKCDIVAVSGLSILLRKYQSLSEFKFKFSVYLDDRGMDHLSNYLLHVTHINLSGCSELTNSTFFLLVRSCPLLVDIKMSYTSLGKEGDLCVDLKKHSQIQFLDLRGSRYLNDESLKRIGYICPNLLMLALDNHRLITEEGISEILESCPGLRHFIFTFSELDAILGTQSEHSKLNIEVLKVCGTRINDEGMAIIGKRCPRLLTLSLTFCSKVTADGVKEVVEKCPKLMELNLRGCHYIDFDLLSPMLLTRPSLRKVFCPDEDFLTEEKRNLFMRHGCRLY